MSELDDASGLECLVGAVFVEGAKAFGRKSDDNCAVEFWYENTFLLEVGLFAHRACWVEFGSTNTVAVAASNLRALIRNRTYFSHILSPRMVS